MEELKDYLLKLNGEVLSSLPNKIQFCHKKGEDVLWIILANQTYKRPLLSVYVANKYNDSTGLIHGQFISSKNDLENMIKSCESIINHFPEVFQ